LAPAEPAQSCHGQVFPGPVAQRGLVAVQHARAGLTKLLLRAGLPRYEVGAFWSSALPGRFAALLKELRGLART
jgi:hypothetical protein